MALTKRLSGFRHVEIQQGDTLQAIAARELGDASLWVDLITINGLNYPYLTGDATAVLEADPGTLKLYGESLIVPAGAAVTSSTDDPSRVFGVDVLLQAGRLVAGPTGDLALVAGRANLEQAIDNRIETPLGDLVWHQQYGCGIHKLKGRGGDVGAVTLSAKYVEAALVDDPRITQAEATAVLAGDAIDVTGKAQPVTGSAIDFTNTV